MRVFWCVCQSYGFKTTPKIKHIPIDKIPDFDVLSIEPRNTARIIKERLTDMGIKKSRFRKEMVSVK